MDRQTQGELFTAEVRWFHIFRSMVDSGDLAKMSGSCVKVYLVIKSYSNLDTGLSFPKLETIAEKAGLSVAQVKRELSFLEERGHITKGRRGRQNIYTLRERLQVLNDHGSHAATVEWTYLPQNVQHTLEAIKKLLSTGEIAGRTAIHLNNIQINVNHVAPGGVAINIQNSLAELPQGIRSVLCSAMEKAGLPMSENYKQVMDDPCHG